MTAYALSMAGLVWLFPKTTAGMVAAIGIASAVPLAVAMTPRLKRAPPTTTKVLSAAPSVPRLPAPAAQCVTGEAGVLSKQVDSHLDGKKCLACELIGRNPGGHVVVRARRSSPFQVKTDSGISVVRGHIELTGASTAVRDALSDKEAVKLGLRDTDLSQVQWSERVLSGGMTVKVYGPWKKGLVAELAAYRDQYADVFDWAEGTLVEVL